MRQARRLSPRLLAGEIVALLWLVLALPVLAQEPLGTLWDTTLPDLAYATGVSSDGSLVVFGGRDGVLYARDAAGNELWQFQLGATIRYVALAADGEQIAVASEDRVATMLDRSGTLLWQYKLRMPPVGIAISDDGTTVVVGEERKPRLSVLDGATGELRWKHEPVERIQAVAVSGDGSRVYTGRRDSRVSCFDATGGDSLWSVITDRVVYALKALNDGSLVLAGGDGRKVNALDGATGEALWSYPTKDRVTAIDATRTGELIVCASWDGHAHLLTNDGELKQTVAGGSRVHAVSITDGGEVIVVGTDEGRVFAVSLASARAAGIARTRATTGMVAGALALLGAAVLGFRAFVRNTRVGQAWWAPTGARLQAFGKAVWKGRLGYLFMLPTLLFLLVLAYFPALMGLALGFTEWKPGQPRPPKWVGLYNYSLVFANPRTPAAMRNVAILTIASLAQTLIGPLLIAEAILALSKPRQRYAWRTLFILPLVVPGVATILMWTNILDPNLGLINNTLFLLGLANPQAPPGWLGDKSLALGSLIFIGFPWIDAFPLLVFYGGLISITPEIFDAAKVDGASGLQRLFRIDIPMLLPQIRLLSILSIIGSLQQFALIVLTTRGGPGDATTTPAYEMYIQGIGSGRYGYAAAMASLLFLVIMAITLVNLRLVRGTGTTT